MSDERPFSTFWLLVSTAIFVVWEVVLGGFVGSLMQGAFTSHMLVHRLEVVLSLGAFFLGGFTVGLVSPGKRLREPAAGAALSIGVTFLIAIFTPYRFWFGASLGRVLLACGIGWLVALYGAHLGEKATGN